MSRKLTVSFLLLALIIAVFSAMPIAQAGEPKATGELAWQKLEANYQSRLRESQGGGGSTQNKEVVLVFRWIPGEYIFGANGLQNLFRWSTNHSSAGTFLADRYESGVRYESKHTVPAQGYAASWDRASTQETWMELRFDNQSYPKFAGFYWNPNTCPISPGFTLTFGNYNGYFSNRVMLDNSAVNATRLYNQFDYSYGSPESTWSYWSVTGEGDNEKFYGKDGNLTVYTERSYLVGGQVCAQVWWKNIGFMLGIEPTPTRVPVTPGTTRTPGSVG